MRVRNRELLVVGLGAVLVAVITACGGSAPSPPAASRSPSPAASATGAPAAIAANWQAFFRASTPISRRVALLQHGAEFAAVIRSQAGSALAQSATAKVTKVTLVSPAIARVTYTIMVGGRPALANQTGTAVLEHGTWKVGAASFCGLLAVENGGKTAGLPAACHAAG